VLFIVNLCAFVTRLINATYLLTSSSVGRLEKFTETSRQKFCQTAKRQQDDVYELLRDYIDGKKPIPRDVTQLVKHHNVMLHTC